MTEELTLWDIDTELREAVELYEEAQTDEDRNLQQAAIRLYLEAHIRKVDKVAAYLRACAAHEAAAHQEAVRARAIHLRWASRAQRVKDMVLALMQERGEKRFEGVTAILRRQTNGGPAPAPIIGVPELVPDDLCTFNLKLSGQVWGQLRAAVPQAVRDMLDFGVRSEPDVQAIKAALERPCDACGGDRTVEINPAGQGHYDDLSEHHPCPICGGTGKNSVPGCRLQERGEHLRCE